MMHHRYLDQWHRLLHATQWQWLIGGSLVLLDWQGMNSVLLTLLGVPNHAYPWSVLIVLKHGEWGVVSLAVALTFPPVWVGYLAWQGGIQRIGAYYVGLAWLGTVGLSVLLQWPPIGTRLPGGTQTHCALMAMAGVYALLGLVWVSRYGMSRPGRYTVWGHAHFAHAFEIQRAGLFNQTGLVLGQVHGKRLRLPGYEGALVVAPTGSGKTTAMAIPNLLEWSGSGVFNDLKGELYRLTADYRRTRLHNVCYRWAPADTQGITARYNPFFYVSAEPSLRIRDLQLIAETLIPATQWGEGFWYQSSREIFITLALYLLETQGQATLAGIYDLSKQADFFVWLLSEIRAGESHFSTPLKQNAYALLGGSRDTQRNTLRDFHSRLGLFSDPLIRAATQVNDFDFRALRRQTMSVYIHIPDADKVRLSPILTLFWTQLIQALASHEPQADEPYGVLALLDEFGTLARIPALKEGLAFLRSYRVRPLILVQYLGQIVSTYGAEDAKAFFNTKVKIAFALNDRDDAQFFSQVLGTQTVKVPTHSVSGGNGPIGGRCSQTVTLQPRALMTPDELMQLSHKKAIIVMEAHPPIQADKCYWFKTRPYRTLLQAGL